MPKYVINARGDRNNSGRTAGFSVWKYAAAGLLALVAATLGFDAYSGRLGIIPPRFETVRNGATKIIKVPAGGNLQAAVDRAESGDIIELEAGATYFGEIKLPNRPLTDYVTIQSSAAANLPADKRVGPEQAQYMAKIVTPRGDRPAISASAGAHHYRFVGIEFAPSTANYTSNLITFGYRESRVENLPHDLEIDRSYLHPYKTGTTRRGIALNSGATTVQNSYIEGFAFMNEETQGICGWTGARNVLIVNNYVEGGAENIMFGGSDPANADLIPMDIEIRGNTLRKPQAWNGKATLKTFFELKNAKRVQFTGNYMETNWEGSALRITVRNQDGGAPFSTIEDVVIRDNIVNGSADGINILGKDDTYPSQTLKRLTIENNLFLRISGGNGYDGSGYFVQIADGENIAIANNTVINTGNITTFYAAMPRDLVFRDNFIGHGNYGINGIGDLRSDQSKAMFQNNVFLNLNRVPQSDYSFPPGNSIIPDLKAAGFTDPSAGDYRLASNSKYKGKGSGGKNIGSDISAAAYIKQ